MKLVFSNMKKKIIGLFFAETEVELEGLWVDVGLKLG